MGLRYCGLWRLAVVRHASLADVWPLGWVRLFVHVLLGESVNRPVGHGDASVEPAEQAEPAGQAVQSD